MNMMELKAMAKAQGLEPGKMTKADLIRAIQNREGNFPCFQPGRDTCDQLNCCWRGDCLSVTATEKSGASKKELYLEKLRIELQEFKNKIDDFKEQAKKMAEKAKAEKAVEEISRLEKKYEEEIKQKMHELAEASEGAWESVRKGTEEIWKDLREAFKKALARIKSSGHE